MENKKEIQTKLSLTRFHQVGFDINSYGILVDMKKELTEKQDQVITFSDVIRELKRRSERRNKKDGD